MSSSAIIGDDGFARYCIWMHSEHVARLYRARARDEAEEMTCAAQAVELLAPHFAPGDSLLDAGCGSGYFYHSLRRRGCAPRGEYQLRLPAYGL